MKPVGLDLHSLTGHSDLVHGVESLFWSRFDASAPRIDLHFYHKVCGFSYLLIDKSKKILTDRIYFFHSEEEMVEAIITYS